MRRLEVWSPAGSDGALYRGDGFCEAAGLLAPTTDAAVASGQGVVGRAFATSVPMLTERAADEPGPIGAAAGAAGWTSVVALPVLRQGRPSAVVAWYF